MKGLHKLFLKDSKKVVTNWIFEVVLIIFEVYGKSSKSNVKSSTIVCFSRPINGLEGRKRYLQALGFK